MAVLCGTCIALAAIPLGLSDSAVSGPIPLLGSLIVAAAAATVTILLLRRATRSPEGTAIERQPLRPHEERLSNVGRVLASVLSVLAFWILPWRVTLTWNPDELKGVLSLAPTVLMAGIGSVAAATGRWRKTRRAAP